MPDIVSLAGKILHWWQAHRYDNVGGHNIYDDPPDFVNDARLIMERGGWTRTATQLPPEGVVVLALQDDDLTLAYLSNGCWYRYDYPHLQTPLIGASPAITRWAPAPQLPPVIGSSESPNWHTLRIG